MLLTDPLWFVAHTRPRCEKKLLEYCQREELSAWLPTYRQAHKYRGQTFVFDKPLFPGYVFLHVANAQRGKIRQSDHVANLPKSPTRTFSRGNWTKFSERWTRALKSGWRHK